MRARSIPSVELDSYQRAARLVLTHHLVTATFPDRTALATVRRWATELRDDLLATFGYRLEVTETTARLFTVADRLDAGAGTSTHTGRPFDRRRYAYLALAIAALGRGAGQITLSELAEHVASEASRVDGVELDTERAADRDAFVDAVTWLGVRGAITLADGDAGGWANDPERGEALYDVDRAVVHAVFRPPRALQHLESVRGLLGNAGAPQSDTSEVRRRVRRALVQRPVVYADDLDEDEALQLALRRTTDEVELLTGSVCERRAEGVALVDTSGRLSDVRFPNTGTVAQVALLLAGEMCDRILDPDAPAPPRLPVPAEAHDALVAAVDTAIPTSTVFTPLAVSDTPIPHEQAENDIRAPLEHPLLEDSWLAGTVGHLVDIYGRTFAAQWQADPAGLTEAAVDMLDRLRLVARVPGGVLALPALARFRGVTVSVRERDPEIDLFPETTPETVPDPDTTPTEIS
ncbi:TIGR02678 family protein [Rhodococcus sp. B50]|uniref:TIGR02678 family protein n=1 Tax=Rhodococcus sp. B50 TaxID=2682847 RepID=UPI001BD49EDA|nr:TIGR02678 family protein [Rhodococcus sp. B50]MBS9372220.1 hypothetical protein [Rhodococcus sp. B50]